MTNDKHNRRRTVAGKQASKPSNKPSKIGKQPTNKTTKRKHGKKSKLSGRRKATRNRKKEDDVIELRADLYFVDKPDLTAEALVESWGREGYHCEIVERDRGGAVAAWRGHTYVRLDEPRKAESSAHPPYYPAITEPKLPYAKTFLIDHRKAFADFQSAKWRVPMTFRILANDGPLVAVNELAITLLGVQQVQPMRALWLEQAGIFVGRDAIIEYTEYCNSQGNQKPSYPFPLMFGVLVTKHGKSIKAWTHGLDHFGHPNLVLESKEVDAITAAQIFFNTSISVVQGHRFRAGETMETGEAFCAIEQGSVDGKPALRFVPK